MHATAHKQDACQIAPWQRKSADRVCEHGDSRLLQAQKASARQQRRAKDKAEARAHSW